MSNEVRVRQLLTLFKGRIDFDNLVPTALALAQELENMGTQLRGPQKLEVLQAVLKEAVKESTLDTMKKEEIYYTIDTTIPLVVQVAKIASKNPIVNQAAASCLSCLKK